MSFRGREIERVERSGGDPAARQYRGQRDDHHGDVAVSAHLGDKPPARLQRPFDAGDDSLGVAHPMQGGVREHRVELGGKGQLLPVHQPRVEAARRGGGDQIGRRIDRDHRGAGRRDPLRQHTVTAAEIEDPLAGPRIEQLDDRHAEHRHKAAGLGIALRLPALLSDPRHVQAFAVSA